MTLPTTTIGLSVGRKRQVQAPARSKQHGLSLVLAIFVLVVLSLLAAAMFNLMASGADPREHCLPPTAAPSVNSMKFSRPLVLLCQQIARVRHKLPEPTLLPWEVLPAVIT